MAGAINVLYVVWGANLSYSLNQRIGKIINRERRYQNDSMGSVLYFSKRTDKIPPNNGQIFKKNEPGQTVRTPLNALST